MKKPDVTFAGVAATAGMFACMGVAAIALTEKPLEAAQCVGDCIPFVWDCIPDEPLSDIRCSCVWNSFSNGWDCHQS